MPWHVFVQSKIAPAAKTERVFFIHMLRLPRYNK